ncbi:MAG: hypothetical protein RBU27_12065 [Bacteroidota bacterium]|jgi:hypothetical protein|nr:hypothetical protein [Bacteroidota bacterium]
MHAQPTSFSFPFGQPVLTVEQQDHSPKKAFVLGVYASAMHARWMNPDGTERVRALAVASEPQIFWDGSGAEEIIAGIDVPEVAGRLVAADVGMNGPSAKALDKKILAPLGLNRDSTWLCDLVPHACQNPSQAEAVELNYTELATKLSLPPVNMIPYPGRITEDRIAEIKAELFMSQATMLITLGDDPIKLFLTKVSGDWKWDSLSEFAMTYPYGAQIPINIDGRTIFVLPLVHPRQVAGLGAHNEHWKTEHQKWLDTMKTGVQSH